jgi:predicted nucleic acid-binding protein
MRFIDSNVLLRYITSDDPASTVVAAEVIRAVVESREEAYITDVHIHEVAYVLASKSLYGLSHEEIRDRLRPLILMKSLKLSNKKACLDALEVFASYPQLDFADALAVATMRKKGITEIYSFDRDFDRVRDIRRIEG